MIYSYAVDADDEYSWHYALGGIWGLIAMVMTILARILRVRC